MQVNKFRLKLSVVILRYVNAWRILNLKYNHYFFHKNEI